MIHQGGSYVVLGGVLHDLLPRLEGITEVYLDDTLVDDHKFIAFPGQLGVNGEPVDDKTGAYRYLIIAETLGDHVIQVKYTGPKGAPDDTVDSVILPFTVVPPSVTIDVTMRINPPALTLTLGDRFTLSGQVNVFPALNVGYVMFYTTDASGAPLLSGLVPTAPLSPLGPPFGLAFIFRNDVRVAVVGVDATGKYTWNGITVRGSHTYRVEYYDYRGRAISPSVTVFPKIPQIVRMDLPDTVPKIVTGTAFAIDQVVQIFARIYSEDTDIPTGTGGKIPITSGSLSVLVDGVAGTPVSASVDDQGNWECEYTTTLGVHELRLEYTGLAGNIQVAVGHVLGAYPNTDVALNLVPDPALIAEGRRFEVHGTVRDIFGGLISGAKIVVYHRQISGGSATAHRTYELPVYAGPDGKWSLSTVAFAGMQGIQASVVEPDGRVGTTPEVQFAPIVVTRGLRWNQVLDAVTWVTYSDYLRWEDL